jgi:CheY-like chemotaxis protein
VEDNPDVRHMLRLVLRRAGHAVTEAHDGPSGVETVSTVRPDVVLIDLDLPGFDGCEVARRIRSNGTLTGVHLIAVSGYGRPEDRERALAAGFDDHMVKPLDFERLANVLTELPAMQVPQMG